MRERFAGFAWLLLAYNIPVILWGAYVRVSFSGDGCGAHWPFCNGTVIPQKMGAPMAIEFTHRAMTSIDLVAAVALCVWAFVVFPRRHAVRRYSILSLVFLLIEALLGAGLVLLRYVAKDQSVGRAWYLSAHLSNTLLLLGAFTATAWLASHNMESIRLRSMPGSIFGSLAPALVISITGAIAALGDTLFPAASIAAGIQQEFSTASATLLRLRMLHPAIAIVGTAYVILSAIRVSKHPEQAAARTAAIRVVVLALLQLAAGGVNIGLLAPVWMQLVHLFVADVLWIALVLLALETASLRREDASRAQPVLELRPDPQPRMSRL